MPQKFSNAARAKLASPISNSATTITLVDSGSLFPVADTGTSSITSTTSTDWFKAVLQDATNIEIVYVRTHTSGSDTFSNVLRAQEGTTAAGFGTDAVIGIRPLASDANAASNLRVPRSSTTGSAVIPAGTTAERDATPAEGWFRYNSTTKAFEGYVDGAWTSIGASGMISGVTELTATAGQTSFTASYTPGAVDVYRNGARLGAGDVTTSSGTAVVLATGAAAGDHIAVVSYRASSIANAVAKSGDTMSGPLTLPGAPTADLHAATKAYVDNSGVAIGEYRESFASSIPGYLKLSGVATAVTAVADTAYPALTAAIPNNASTRGTAIIARTANTLASTQAV